MDEDNDRVTMAVAFAIFWVVWLAIVLAMGSCAPQRVRPVELRPDPPQVRVVESDVLVRDALVDAYNATAKVEADFTDEDGDAAYGYGSGALVEADDMVAWLLTANHVVAPTDAKSKVTLHVTFSDGHAHLAQVACLDAKHDLALIQVLGHIARRPISVGKTSPALMERVWEIGASDGEMPPTVGEGRWGQLEMVELPASLFAARTVVGGFAFPGMSGGPVVDARGQIQGVISSIHCVDDACGGPETWVPEMAYVVDVRDVRAIMLACETRFAK